MSALPQNAVSIQALTRQDWRRYRALRIASLISDPDAFGGDLARAESQDQSYWESKFEKLTPVVAMVNGKDCALLTIENLNGDFGATCWIGGCWVAKDYRRQGLMRSLFNYLDENAQKCDWSVQGLGVWQYNQAAIETYLALGFENKGEPVPSTLKPGLFYQRMIRKAKNA